MIRAVVLRRAARREFDDAALWYEERRVGLGAEFVAEIERALGLVAENPERFPIMHRDIRCAPIHNGRLARFKTGRIRLDATWHRQANH
jgi:toxin ParE1/3/4